MHSFFHLNHMVVIARSKPFEEDSEAVGMFRLTVLYLDKVQFGCKQ